MIFLLLEYCPPIFYGSTARGDFVIDLEGLSALDRDGVPTEKLTFPEGLGADLAAEQLIVRVLFVGVYSGHLRDWIHLGSTRAFRYINKSIAMILERLLYSV